MSLNQAKDQNYRPSDEGEQRGPVYLVNGKSKIISKNIYNAYVYTDYEGADDEIYFFLIAQNMSKRVQAKIYLRL